MKEQNKMPAKELNEVEKSNLTDAEFKTLVVRLHNELIGYFNSIKKTQVEMKITLSEIKIYREPTVKYMKQRIKSMTCNKRQKKTFNQKHSIRKTGIIKNPKNKDRLRSLWDNFKHKIRIIGVPEGEEKGQEIENLLENIMKENFPNLVKEIDIQVQKAWTVPNTGAQTGPHQDTS